jgi:hypothetical protein
VSEVVPIIEIAVVEVATILVGVIACILAVDVAARGIVGGAVIIVMTGSVIGSAVIGVAARRIVGVTVFRVMVRRRTPVLHARLGPELFGTELAHAATEVTHAPAKVAPAAKPAAEVAAAESAAARRCVGGYTKSADCYACGQREKPATNHSCFLPAANPRRGGLTSRRLGTI